MKRISAIILSAFCLLLFTATAQNQGPVYLGEKGTVHAPTDSEYSCPDNSVFSQLATSIDGWQYCDNSYIYSRAADDYIASGSFSSMRFWGTQSSCEPGVSQTFHIKFYERNLSNPYIPGNELYSFTVSAIPDPIVLFSGLDYQIDVDFGSPVTLTDGWVSITRINPGDGCPFGWLGGFFPGNSVSYDSINGSWVGVGGDLSFCLGGGVLTPLSGWALFIGIGLILAFAVIRLRRIA